MPNHLTTIIYYRYDYESQFAHPLSTYISFCAHPLSTTIYSNGSPPSRLPWCCRRRGRRRGGGSRGTPPPAPPSHTACSPAYNSHLLKWRHLLKIRKQKRGCWKLRRTWSSIYRRIFRWFTSEKKETVLKNIFESWFYQAFFRPWRAGCTVLIWWTAALSGQDVLI